jgi:ribonuclease BN (tRNA processing enzyme)
VKLTIVGCSGSGPGPKSPASCYLVEHDGFRLVLDLGNGSFGTLQGIVEPDTIDALYITHLHADHCLDIAPFVVWHRYSGRSSGRPIPLHGPAGAAERLALAYDGEDADLTDVFDFSVVTPGERTIGPFEVETVRTAHPVECNAIRLTAGGRSLVYTGDTGASQRVVDLARGADVLLAEAAHAPGPDLPTGLHLTGREAGEHAAAAGVGRLLITHVPSWVDEIGQLVSASAVFSETELVQPGATYEI